MVVNQTAQKPKIIIVCGPTGLGKTAAAIELAQIFNGEIVGADSMQVYRHMDIGTAKPTKAEQSRVRHHMIDIVDPDEPFDAARYARTARGTIAGILDRGVRPFVVGGTGFYIKALLHGLFQSPPAEAGIRERLKAEEEARGIDFLYRRLQALDTDASASIHPNDAYRIRRALEVRESTGTPISALHRDHRFSDQPFDGLVLGLRMERAILYERIDRRVDHMVRAGLLKEVEGLLNSGYSPDLKPMQSIGYRHMIDYIQGNTDWDETIRLFKRDTRRYAKRQLTWFRRDSSVLWDSPENLSAMCQQIESFLED